MGKQNSKLIPVTKPFLPPKEEFELYLEGIWDRNWLTNNGPLSSELELKLKKYLDVPHLLFTSNGTIALQIAIKSLNLTGEIITTPFSYVATTSSIVWENCKPIFVDIDPNSLNLDHKKIEDKITSKTTAILATHVFGNACEIESIEEIANRHKLKVIYDGAHCFGVKYRDESIFNYGDITTTSFHSTKLFHTVEGGAVFSKDPELIKKMAFMRNFGHNGPSDYYCVGINGKNSEFHAAMGLSNLKYVTEVIGKRKEICNYYNAKLQNMKIRRPGFSPDCETNFAYYPIIFESKSQLEKSLVKLNNSDIFPRRYFYPSLSTLNYVQNQEVPIARDISERVLCLPLYVDLSAVEIEYICRILLRTQNY